MQITTNQFQKELKKHGNHAFPLLISYEKLSNYETGAFLWHWHPEVEISLIQTGEMLYKVNHCTYHLKKGDILFGNANVLHSGYMIQNQDCHYISITFDPKLIYGFQQSIINQKYVEPLTQDFSLPAIHFDFTQSWHTSILESILRIVEKSEQKPDFFEVDITVELLSLWKTILAHRSPSVAYAAHDKIAFDRIRMIIGYIEKNYRDKISLEEVAGQIHLCTSECSRLFKTYMNVSLFTFLQEYRIEKSLDYLMDSSYSITDVASMAGYSDSNYYSKVFAKIKGCSPRQYRKEQLRITPSTAASSPLP